MDSDRELFQAVPRLAEHELNFTSAVAQDRGPELFMAGLKYADRKYRDCEMLLRNLAADIEVIRFTFPEVQPDVLLLAEREQYTEHLVKLGVSGTELAEGVSMFEDLIGRY